MTEEEKREAQLKADLNHTNELFGVAGSLDSISLKSKEDYTEYINRFFARLNVLNVDIIHLKRSKKRRIYLISNI